MKKTLRLYYLTRTDNLEGNVKLFIQSVKFENYNNVKIAVKEMAENSDRDMSHEPLYLTDLKGRIILDYREAGK